ncbi:MAG: hypothetical protein ACREMY_04070, partial [bacterium]
MNSPNNALWSMQQGWGRSRKPPLPSLLVILLLSVVATGLGSPGPALGASPTADAAPISEITPDLTEEGFAFEVQSYEEDFGVSAQTAERNLLTQQDAIGVVEGLEHALGESYAGVWFDNESGEFVVPVLGASNLAVVS